MTNLLKFPQVSFLKYDFLDPLGITPLLRVSLLKMTQNNWDCCYNAVVPSRGRHVAWSKFIEVALTPTPSPAWAPALNQEISVKKSWENAGSQEPMETKETVHRRNDTGNSSPHKRWKNRPGKKQQTTRMHTRTHTHKRKKGNQNQPQNIFKNGVFNLGSTTKPFFPLEKNTS